MRKRSRRKTRLHIITSCDSSVWRQQQISQHHSHHITPQSTEALHEVCTPLYVIHTCIDLNSCAVMHTHTCIYTQVAGQVQCAALSCHPPLADLLFSRSSERLLLMNYAAAGPCNKLQADSTPCVWLKI